MIYLWLWSTLLVWCDSPMLLETLTQWWQKIQAFEQHHTRCQQLSAFMMAWQRVIHDHREICLAGTYCHAALYPQDQPPDWLHHRPILSDILVLYEDHRGKIRQVGYFLSDSLETNRATAGPYTLYRQVPDQHAQPWFSGWQHIDFQGQLSPHVLTHHGKNDAANIASHHHFTQYHKLTITAENIDCHQSPQQLTPCSQARVTYVL